MQLATEGRVRTKTFVRFTSITTRVRVCQVLSRCLSSLVLAGWKHTTHKTQHTTYNTQHTTHDTQRTTQNTQHSYVRPDCSYFMITPQQTLNGMMYDMPCVD